MVIEREAGGSIGDPEARKAEFLRKREEYESKAEQVVTLPRPDAQQMRSGKRGPSDLIEYQINPLIEEFQASPEERNDWTAFESAFEESVHQIQMNIRRALNRDSRL
jgi:hypothetical protein